MTRITTALFVLVGLSLLDVTPAAMAQDSAIDANPCEAPAVVRKAKTVESVRDPKGRYMKRMRRMGENPFGEPTSPATVSIGTDRVDLFTGDAIKTLDPIPDGWALHTFRKGTTFEIVEIDGMRAVQGATDKGAAILFRHSDIALAEMPILNWTWRVDDPIVTDHCDHTKKGDDKAARLFVTLETESGDARCLEIVWANHLESGDYTYVHAFPHYVSDGRAVPFGEWQTHSVNLLRLSETFWPGETMSTVRGVGYMVDGDQSRGAARSLLRSLKLSVRFAG